MTFENVKFKFENGKIVEASSNDTVRLNEILDSDDGARHIGEFAIGFNPYILHPMKDILFDEKIAGSLHFTPGQAYDVTDNGNRSSIHWDLVLIQRPEYGGGEIYFDDVLIRKGWYLRYSGTSRSEPRKPEIRCNKRKHLARVSGFNVSWN